MILQKVGHQISCLGVCYANDPKKGGYMTPAPALDLTTSLPIDLPPYSNAEKSPLYIVLRRWGLAECLICPKINKEYPISIFPNIFYSEIALTNKHMWKCLATNQFSHTKNNECCFNTQLCPRTEPAIQIMAWWDNLVQVPNEGQTAAYLGKLEIALVVGLGVHIGEKIGIIPGSDSTHSGGHRPNKF